MTEDKKPHSLTSGSIKNILFKILSELISKPLILIYTIILTHLLSPSDYGTFTVAITFAIFAGVISDFGLSTIVLRETSIYEGAKLRQFISTLFSLKLIIIVIIIILSTVFIIYGPIHFADNNVAIILTISLSFYWFIEVFFSIFRSKFLPEKETLLFILWRVILLISTIILVFIYRNTISAALSHLLASIAIFILGILLVRRFISHIDFQLSKDTLNSILKSSVFIFFSSLFIIAYFRIDIIIMNLTGIPSDEIGRYGAVYKIIDAMMVFPAAIATGVFPALSMVAKYKKEDIVKAGQLLRPMLFFGLLCPIVITPISRPVITLIYGAPFIPAYNILNILLWALPFIFVNYILYSILISLGFERFNMIATLICLVFNVVLNLILIPKLALTGAAITTVLTEVVLLLSCSIILIRQIKANILLLIFGFIISIIIVIGEYCINRWWTLIPAIAVFVSISFISCLIKRDDIALILSNVKSRK
jgi:O-antigen/teichoic acid export membrane protein